MRQLIVLPAAASAALLVACATPWNIDRLEPGATKEEVISRAGPPTRTLPRRGGDGERLQYTLQPMGQEAYIVDLDGNGRVVSAGQMLTQSNFETIRIGRSTVADVEYDFGPPAAIDHVASWSGTVYTYRWRMLGTDTAYMVYFTPDGIVGRAHPGMDRDSPYERANM